MSSNAIDVIKEKIDSVLAKYPVVNDPLTELSSKVKVEKAFLAVGIAAVPILILLFCGAGGFFLDVIGLAYPMYCSIIAIER